jgi:hypothetical protein
MSYSSSRSLAQSAKHSTDDEAIVKLADAIYALSRAIEQDIDRLDRDVRRVKSEIG